MTSSSPYLGIIEGFFGTSWSWKARADYATFLRQNGYSFYVYAPKEDPFLRKRWREAIPHERLVRLEETAALYKKHHLHFGVGLSPFEAYLDYDATNKGALQDKVRVLNQVSPDILCVLFDDMKGDFPNLAEMQIRILNDIADVATASRIIFCPTYYTTDPIVERVFGAMPVRYLEDLGRGLDKKIDIFWTGPKVCSTEYPRDHLEEVASRMQRKPFLWDNYPVNDSKKMSPFIYVAPFTNRGGDLADLVSGHASNPMKQAYLSQIPLASLALNYSRGAGYIPSAAYRECVEKVCGAELVAAFEEDFPLFNDIGLDNLSEQQRTHLRDRYGSWQGNPFCQEILEWLDGKYVFDPACLTE